MLQVGDSVPEFTLKTVDREPFTRENLRGQRSVLTFIPFAFSTVCSDHLTLYQRELARFEAVGAKLYGISVDSIWALGAFAKRDELTFPLLSDFFPHGATAEQFGVLGPDGFNTRSVFIVEPDLTVSWSFISPAITDIPPVEEVLAALQSAA